MKLKNFDELAVNGSRRAALAIAEAGLLAIDTKTVIRRSVALEPGALIVAGDRYALSPGSRVVVAGVGKCSLDAAAALEDILGDRISRGAVIDVRTGAPLKIIRAMQGTHPLPTEENVKAALAIVDILKGLTEKDLVIFVISGGGSTLLCLPDDMGCEDEANIFQSLTRAGATIQEINTVRKHLSTARGGYLAKYAYPARVASLIFS
ncbi:MAG TPA: glycerate-2-kinase family protein, partial [Candidatus Paceibacterota bacterium]|nr:glycerate-2-kinase family protein [Candidatus Paceibacterota bacterium]